MYLVLWHCLYPTILSATSGLNDIGVHSLRSDLSPTPGYLIVGMIICVIKTTVTPSCSLVARDRLRSHGEVS